MPDLECIDYPALPLPSDSISIGHLRRLFPDQFNGPYADAKDSGPVVNFFSPVGPIKEAVDFFEMLASERVLAWSNFYFSQCAANSISIEPDAYQNLMEEREHAASMLEQYYQQFGLADGPETARLLIRSIQQNATEQATQRSQGRS
jgi:hypothetical protein